MSVADQIYAALDPVTKANMLAEHVTAMTGRIAADDYIGALRQADSAARLFSDLCADVAQAAYDAGATKKAIADALGVSPATFRGMVKS